MREQLLEQETETRESIQSPPKPVHQWHSARFMKPFYKAIDILKGRQKGAYEESNEFSSSQR